MPTTEKPQADCPICLSEACIRLMIRDGVTFYECNMCGMEYWVKNSPQLEEKGE